MNQDNTINYLEIPSRDLAASKRFFTDVFDWTFTDYGEQYTAFTSPTLEGGIFLSEFVSTTANGACLIVFYSETLESVLQKVVNAGATMTKEIFSFPGGRRFQFCEPGGSEFAVWSDNN